MKEATMRCHSESYSPLCIISAKVTKIDYRERKYNNNTSLLTLFSADD